LPLSFRLSREVSPLFAKYFGDVWIGEAGMFCDDGSLVVLAVEYESYCANVASVTAQSPTKQEKAHTNLLSHEPAFGMQ
jgi:hypothetical protein